MRVVWRDTKHHRNVDKMYRGYKIIGTPYGWETDIPGDDNYYLANVDALNAIDKYLGGTSQKGEANRRRGTDDIRILGKKSVTA